MIFLKRTLTVAIVSFVLFQLLLYVCNLLPVNNSQTETCQRIEQSNTSKPTYQYLRDVTVRIEGEAYDNETERMVAWCGTGVVVKETDFYTYILTNRHVVGKSQEDDLEFIKLNVIDDNRGNPHVATLISTHNYYDMAVITVRGKLCGKKVIKGITQVKIQDAVYLVGESLGRHLIYGEGVVAGYDNTNTIIQLPAIYGNSGSGVFNSDGLLVGLLYSGALIPIKTTYGDLGFVPVFTHANIVDGIYVQLYLNEVLR